MKKTLALLLTLFVVLTVSTVTVFAAETDVAKIGDVGYATLKGAIDALADGDTLTIMEGTYDAALTVTKNNVTVIGQGNVVLNGVPTLRGTNYRVENIDFNYSNGYNNLSGSGLIKDCTFTATENTFRYCYGAKDGVITFEGTTFNPASNGWAIHFDSASGTDLTFTDCVINGKVALASDLGSLTATGTAFNKAYVNVWGTDDGATFEECEFNDVPYVFTGYDADNTVDFNDCTVVNDGNSANVADIIYGGIDNADAKIYEDEVLIGGGVAKIGTTQFETLAEALAAAKDGDEISIISAGTYKVPSGKNITVTGAVDGVVFDNIGAHNMGSASVTFNNVTFNYAANSTYEGLQHSGNLVYNNCIFNGQVFLYGLSETFNTCTFNNIGDNYNVWTYGAKEVVFNGCTFNSDGKSVLVYNESATHFINLTVVDSDFNASAPVDGKAAIEIDTSLTAGANISVDAATTATGFGTGNKSGNSLWNNKKGNDTEANNDVTVAVAGETVLKPVVLSLSGTGTAEDPFLINNLEELIWFRDHVDSCEQDGSSQYAGKYIKLTADIDLEGINWDPIGSATADHGSFYGCFDGDGHTIYNLYVEKEGKGLGFFAKTSGGGDGPRAQVKNLNFHNVTVKSTDNSSYVGGVIGNSGGNTYIENVHLTGTINISGYGYVGGIVGHGYPDIRNCSVDGGDASKSIIACGYWAVGGIVGYSGNEEGPETIGCSVKNITIKTAIYGAGSILGVGHKGDITDITAENVVVTAPGTPDANGLLVGCNYKEITGNSWTKNVTLIVDGIIVDNPQDMIAKVNEVSYITLQAALAAATDGDTVILLNNISDSVDYNVNKTLTLDLNGYEIASDAAATLTATAGKLTIVDNSAEKTGAIVSNGKKAIHSSASVEILSGKFVGTITTANNQADDSQVSISGGNFSVEPNANIVKHTYVATLAEDGTYNVVMDEYEVIINGNGATVFGEGFYNYGEIVYINAVANGNYIFAGWLSDDVTIQNAGSANAYFVMPDHAVTVTAYWANSGISTPVAPVVTGTLYFETNGGTAIDSLTGVSGRKVDLTQYVPALEGYTFAGWYSDAALTKPVTEITLRGTKTVYAGWIKNVTPDVPVVTMPFTDVAADAYYYNAVLWAVNTGITNGITDTTFAPDMVCTRAQVVTFLWRAAGCPVATNNDMPFADVSRDMYYYDAVLWAVEMGITNGISDTEFAPDAECSRAQIVTFLWRALGAPDAAADAGFVDVDADAYYATAVEWAVDNGITNGMGDNTFGADADCTRGQTVTFLFRFFCK